MKKIFAFLFVLISLNSISEAQVTNIKDSANTIIPETPAKINGETVVCIGKTQTYTIEPVKNATSYYWSVPSGWSGSSTSTSITTVIGQNGGNICVVSKNNDKMSKLVRVLPVSVNVIPNKPGKIKGDSSVCIGVLKTYSINPVAGATFYTWALPSGWKGTSTNYSITLTTGTEKGNILVTAGNICGSSPPQNKIVEVIPIPDQPGKIIIDNPPTDGNYAMYSVEPLPNTLSYSWILPASWIGSSTTNKIKAVIGPSGGSITVKANNQCGSGNTSKLVITK
jgi:large repetitive protein